jgi:thermitase
VAAPEQLEVHRLAASARNASPPSSSRLKTGGVIVTEIVQVAVGATSVADALRSYRQDPRVLFAEPDYVVSVTETPNDTHFSLQWNMTKIDAQNAWNTTHGSTGVTVAVLDCGVFDEFSGFTETPGGPPGHPDLRGKVLGAVDFTGSPHGTMDWCGHGSHVAGVVAANTNNLIGVAGVGYNSRLLNVKVLNDLGSGSSASLVNGISWAASHSAKVITMSLGAAGPCPVSVQNAIDSAWAQNIVVVASAGNDGTSAVHWPAGCNHVVAVANTDQNDSRAGTSEYGSWVDVAAPGTSIPSTYATSSGCTGAPPCWGYAYLSGTSMAAPHVAGLAALLWTTPWGTSAQSVVDRIGATADSIIGTGTLWQYGRINAARAVASALAPCTTVDFNGSPSSPQVIATAVSFTATAGCGSSTAQYKWWIQTPGGAWGMVQDWGANTLNWNTTGLVAGAYNVGVWARAVGSSADYETALGKGYDLLP